MSEWKMRQTDSAVYFVSGPFSQWHPSPFEAKLPVLVQRDGRPAVAADEATHRFSHAEQAMMASKAAIFGDVAVLGEILVATSPKKQKELGRSVEHFDAVVWTAVSYQIVAVMNYHKFHKNPDLGRVLLDTGDRHLVEGAWYDPIWGVGLSWDNPAIEDSDNWRGTNWLGEALMAVRDVIRAEGRHREATIDPWNIAAFSSVPTRPSSA